MNHIDVVGVEFQIARYDFTNAPVLPSVPFINPLAFPNPHGSVKEQCPADEIESSEFNSTDQIQVKDVFIVECLLFQLGQRFFKGPFPELMVSQGGHNRDIARNKLSEDKRKLAHLTRPNGISSDNHDIGRDLGDSVYNLAQKRSCFLGVEEI